MGDEAECGFGCVSKKAQGALAVWGGWGHLGHEVSGHCRDSQGTKEGAEDETIHFSLA